MVRERLENSGILNPACTTAQERTIQARICNKTLKFHELDTKGPAEAHDWVKKRRKKGSNPINNLANRSFSGFSEKLYAEAEAILENFSLSVKKA